MQRPPYSWGSGGSLEPPADPGQSPSGGPWLGGETPEALEILQLTLVK